MKNKIFALALSAFTAALFVACSADDGGATPGGDSQPVATMYSYATTLPYNADNDVQVRVAVNNQVNAVYLFAEKTETYDENFAALGEAGYKDYVIEHGTKLDELNDQYVDSIFTGLFGEWTISAVAVGKNNTKNMFKTTFLGLDWEDITDGIYNFGILNSRFNLASHPTTLQVCTTDSTLLRFKDVYAEGYSLKFVVTEDTNVDEFGYEYNYCRVAPQQTAYSYGSYGAIYVRDIAYWQGGDDWIFDYPCLIYLDDYYAKFMLQHYVSAGSLGYNAFDVFTPASYYEE